MTELIRQEEMNSRHRTLIKRIMLVITMMFVMLVLCGCRTRLTNNDEVSNVIYDEEGYRYDEYQMRRDELGLSTAKKPIFTGFGTPEDDSEYYDYGSDSQMLEDYEPSEEDVYPDDEEESTSSSSSSSSSRRQSGSSSSRRVIRHGSSSRRSSSGSKKITIALEPNGGTCSQESISVTVGGKYGKLPGAKDVSWEGHKFLGWYTRESGGSKVTENSKVPASGDRILYAHWDPEGEITEGKKVKLDKNSPADAIREAELSASETTLEEGDIYPELPSPSCVGFEFKGWYTAKEDGSGTIAEKGKKASSTADPITLYAHWEKKAQEYLTAKLNDAASAIPDEDLLTYSVGSDHTEFLQDCGMKKGGDDYDYLIFFGKEEDAVAGDKPTIVIPDKAIKGTQEEQLLCKYKLITTLYEKTGLDPSAAAEELGIDAEKLEEIEKEIVIIDAAAEEPADGGEGTGENDENNEDSGTGGEGEGGE